MRITSVVVAAALIGLSAPALAQTAGDAGAAPAPGMAAPGPRMNEGRASSLDRSQHRANAARRGAEMNGEANGNNNTRNNGQ